MQLPLMRNLIFQQLLLLTAQLLTQTVSNQRLTRLLQHLQLLPVYQLIQHLPVVRIIELMLLQQRCPLFQLKYVRHLAHKLPTFHSISIYLEDGMAIVRQTLIMRQLLIGFFHVTAITYAIQRLIVLAIVVVRHLVLTQQTILVAIIPAFLLEMLVTGQALLTSWLHLIAVVSFYF